MAKIRIVGSGDKYDGMFVKTIDKQNEKIEFTNDSSKAYEREGGFYVNSEIDFLKFYFIKEFPCLAYAKPY